MKTFVVLLLLLCSFTAAAAPPWLPAPPPLVAVEHPLTPAPATPFYASGWYWLIWSAATLQTGATVALGLTLFFLSIIRSEPMLSSPPAPPR